MAKKINKTDGLGPFEIAKIRSAIRQVWQRSHARQLCVKRCIGKGGYSYCELCKKRAPKVHIDHIEVVGNLDGDFISRLFCPSSALQGLCKNCHQAKTNEERRQAKLLKKKKNVNYF